MQLKNLNNLLELFFQQYKIQNKNSIFLSSLKNKDEVYSWEKTFRSIINLSEQSLNILIKEIDVY